VLGTEQAVNGRSAPDNHEEPQASYFRLSTPLPTGIARHDHQPIRSRTEEVAAQPQEVLSSHMRLSGTDRFCNPPLTRRERHM
jgi:hypothetical protein